MTDRKAFLIQFIVIVLFFAWLWWNAEMHDRAQIQSWHQEAR